MLKIALQIIVLPLAAFGKWLLSQFYNPCGIWEHPIGIQLLQDGKAVAVQWRNFSHTVRIKTGRATLRLTNADRGDALPVIVRTSGKPRKVDTVVFFTETMDIPLELPAYGRMTIEWKAGGVWQDCHIVIAA